MRTKAPSTDPDYVNCYGITRSKAYFRKEGMSKYATSTLEYLEAMRLSAMAEELNKQTENSTAFSKLGFEERIAFVTDSEWNRRQANKLKKYIHREICYSRRGNRGY